jgi:cyclic beta-1,2-glucan synthetase
LTAGILLGYYAKQYEARTALWTLLRRGFLRVALVHKTAEGSIRTTDPFFWVRFIGVLLFTAGFAALTGMGIQILQWARISIAEIPGYPILLLAGGFAGLPIGWLVIRRARYGVRRRLLASYSRILAPEETVLILLAPMKALRLPLAVLRESGETPPAVFLFHPERPDPGADIRNYGVPQAVAQLEEHARQLAKDHRMDSAVQRDFHLLKRLARISVWIAEISLDLSDATRLEQVANPVVEWILDNQYILDGNARDVQRNLTKRFYGELPILPDEPFRGFPRAYGIAKELVSLSDLRVDRENILAFLDAYQKEKPLRIAELWAIPQMLRIVLIEGIQTLMARAVTELHEREMANYWSNRLITANRKDANLFFSFLAELAESQPDPSPYFASQLMGNLADETSAILPVQNWLERTLKKSLRDLNLREQSRQSKDLLSIGNAVTSLRVLALLDWRKIFERLSRVEQVLRLDPAGIYAQMDFRTRDRYRRAVEELARGSGLEEEQVARRALEAAAASARDAAGDLRRLHIGLFLIREGREALARSIHGRDPLRERILRAVYRYHTPFFLIWFFGIPAAILPCVAYFGLGGLPPLSQILALFLLLIPVSQFSLDVEKYLLTRLLPARTLPKMDFEKTGIPDAFRTLVVVPLLLANTETIREEVSKLEIRYLANPENNLLYGLFTDFMDCDAASCEEDAGLVKTVAACLEDLNRRIPGDRFFLFHRERAWSETEQKFIGWERKRGKLEELNRLIDGTRASDAPRLVYVGDPECLANVRYVITLDSDTQLPRSTARRMIETLAHPLNQPRFDGAGQIVPGSFAIIQPRVSPSLPSTNKSPFTRLYADAIGIDPYTLAVSDVYMDLTGEGSYHGKGIYDVRAFSRVLAGRFPEGWLLSHDLVEGAHVRVGLASDIELYDEFPQDYMGYIARQHRWIRGDWQAADWMLPSIPLPSRERGPNPLPGFERWKVFDNLRRSLVPATSVGLLAFSWMVSIPLGMFASALVAAQLLFQSLALPVTWATTPKGWKAFSVLPLAHNLKRAAAKASMLPFQAGVAMDAILRVWHRQRISHRKLLEWNSAQLVKESAPGQMSGFLWALGAISVLSVLLAAAVAWRMPGNGILAYPWLALWFVSPFVGWYLNHQPPERPANFRLPDSDERLLRRIARLTWRYFADFVGPETSWLPPDNYQVSHITQLAMRTSPTNIGLWMLSSLAARAYGYQTPDRVIDSLTHTMDSIAKLERYEGHLLNWYNIQTLAPLEPRYVSTVDSGNLIGALWAHQHGLEDMLAQPLFDRRTMEGLRDTGEILRRHLEEEIGAAAEKISLDNLLLAWKAPPRRTVDLVRRLRKQAEDIHALEDRRPPATESAYWAGQLRAQHAAWLEIADRYLQWMDILAEEEETELASWSPGLWEAVRHDLENAPSLAALASGDVDSIRILESLRAQSAPAPREWIDRLLRAFSDSKWLAGEMLDRGQRLGRQTEELSESIQLGFLYDVDRRLFSIGYNVSNECLDNSFYDLLASEARLGSFVAIARGDVPMAHWFSMGRLYNTVGRRQVLLSWTGTMFEYLMPQLLQESFEHSLLDKAVKDAVTVQREYGRLHRVPWGISESAFGDLDINKTYQYKAFGVPALGLKRGLEEEMVVAPYASLLALSIAPKETIENLRTLDRLGLLKDFGFYEAIDFSRQPSREAKRGVIIRTYMAHHQGMGFLSLTNFLHDGALRRQFHADPRVRSAEPLLQERIPLLPPLYSTLTRGRTSTMLNVDQADPVSIQFDTPHTDTPKTQLLCNGSYSLMVTNAGGGYSRWQNMDLTRWRSDRTQDAWGTFCYIRETDPERVWCNTYHPTGGKLESYSVHFPLDRAVFRRVDGGIETETEIVVSPEDDVEIRRMTLINHSVRTRRLELTSYVELALAPHNADRQHPAFQKLFIETEADPQLRALVAHRRPRDADVPEIYVAHRFTADAGGDEEWQFETDRRRFVGRGYALSNPMAIAGKLGKTQGFVLDPILSLRHSVTLSPGQHVRVSMVMAAGETRAHVASLMAKYADPHAIDRALDLAWARSQLELRLLRIQPEEARRFQKLASHLLFPNPLMRPAATRMEENQKGQSGLWPYGISGDVPIVLVTIAEAREIGLIRQVIQAHAYWRMHGLMADLVILNEEAGGYERPLRERLEDLIRANSMYTGVNRTGGIYLLSADQIPEEDLKLFRAVARIMFVAARGTLPQQLGVPINVPDLPDPLPKKRIMRDPSAPLPFLELPFFNSLGGFTPDGHEYAIYLGPGTHTPAPWVNVIANPKFGTLLSESGSGFTWFGNSQRNRLTQWSNDPVLDPPSEAVFIRDEETGVYWSPTAMPVRQETAYRARHGAGYTVFEHNSFGIEQELMVFVPVDEQGGMPVKLQILRLRNDSPRRRKLSATYYVEWTLDEHRESSQMHILTRWDDEVRAVIAQNHYHPEYGGRTAFASMSPAPESYSADRTTFIGRNQSILDPAGMDRIQLSRRIGAGFDPCAVLQIFIELEPGESGEVTCILGQAETLEEAHRLVLAYQDRQSVEQALNQTRAWWDDLLGTIEVHTPELAVDLLVNRWLLFQTLSCRIWGRSAFYQSGGAFGFRDQLQDCMALVYAKPAIARDVILLAASRQFKEGDVQHWWHPPAGAGVRTRISDDLLWLPYAVAHYVRITGDADILKAEVPFLNAPLLADQQKESFLVPEATLERASLFEHCRRAVSRGLTTGPHGLPLMGTGDWNDGMNQVGVGGRGESVWLAWFLVDVLQGMDELAEAIGQKDLRPEYQQQRRKLIQRVEQEGWDGAWYLRATFDDGSLLGSSTNTEARIDSLPQSWARLSGAAQDKRAAQALDSVWEHLVRETEGLVLLFDPPFENSQPSPGYIQSYPPGVRENGGQYTHAAIWYAMALARQGDGTRAEKILHLLNPIEHARDFENVWRYGLEPYTMAADVYRLADRVGHGGWSWYTGSSAWMYRAWVEEMLGLKLRGTYLQMDPVIPGWWDGFNINLRQGESLYEIRVDNPDKVERGVAWVEMDGRRMPDGRIPLERGLIKHRVLVRMGKVESATKREEPPPQPMPPA